MRERCYIIWCHKVGPAHQTNSMPLLIFSQRWGKVMEMLPYDIWRSSQSWQNVCATYRNIDLEIKFAVELSMLYWRYYSIHDILWWGELTIQCWGNTFATTLQIWRRSIDVVKTSWIWRHDFNVLATLSIRYQ